MGIKVAGSVRKGLNGLMLATTVLVLVGCSTEDTKEPPSGEVVVNNGQELVEDETSEVSEEEVKEESNEEEVSESDSSDAEGKDPVKERTVVQDKVPKTTRETLSWGDEVSVEMAVDKPDLSEEYVEINDGQPENVNYDITYTLYYQDESSRTVGGEGVVKLGTLTSRPEQLEGVPTKLHEMKLLDTGLLSDERGLEARNKVTVTHQAYNRVMELNQNIYDVVESTPTDNHVYISVEALYYGEEVIPYGIHYQAQSIHGDIKFNYIINNVQEGEKVNYTEGTLGTGEGNE